MLVILLSFFPFVASFSKDVILKAKAAFFFFFLVEPVCSQQNLVVSVGPTVFENALVGS